MDYTLRSESKVLLNIPNVDIINEVREIKGVAGVHIMAIEWESAAKEIASRANLLPRPVFEIEPDEAGVSFKAEAAAPGEKPDDIIAAAKATWEGSPNVEGGIIRSWIYTLGEEEIVTHGSPSKNAYQTIKTDL